MNSKDSNDSRNTDQNVILERAKSAFENPDMLIAMPSGLSRQERREWLRAQITKTTVP